MIGDVLTSSVLFELLREKFPDAQLNYLIYKHTFPVVENNPFIDEFILYEDSFKRIDQQLVFLKKIRSKNYDVIIDVYSKLGTALISAFSGAKATISYKKWYTSFCYTHTFSRKTQSETGAGLAIENRLQLLDPLFPKYREDVKPKIFLTASEVEFAKNRLSKAGLNSEYPLFMISVLGSSEEKTYPHLYIAILLDQIVEETNGNLLFNYIPFQREVAEKILNLCKHKTKAKIHPGVTGRNLREFLALTNCCDALVGNEGGAVNMAKALNIPTFSIFSPQIPKDDWAIFENDTQNISVHLKDYRPEYFRDVEKKKLIDSSEELYLKFKPELFSGKLSKFLQSFRK